MKILLVNWSWYPTGGDWTYIVNVQKLYESRGYEIIPFSTHNKKNVPSPYSENFVNAYDFKELNANKNINNGIKALKTSVISKDAVNKLELLLSQHDIKVAHLHNIHHYITPAIIEVLHEKGIKIIWTLHDFKIICPENSFFSNGNICEKCITGDFYHCASNLCKKQSFLASSLASFEAYYYHRRHTYDLVDYYLCPSEFLLKKFVQFGFDKSKFQVTHSCYDISLIDNFIEDNPLSYTAATEDKYVLYIGRLEDIKGVDTLIEAVKGTPVKLKIVGSGASEQKFKDLASGCNNIEFLGFKNMPEIFMLTMKSLFVVCPSICYENLPFSVIESFLFSKPVVGAKIGGIPELVIDGKTGLLFEAGNATDMREKITYLWNHENMAPELGKSSREHAYEMVNFSNHWSKIESILKKLS
ncbi:MAG: glycosyltransferase family 4 protein [Ferruginibacter sp.]